MLVLSDPGQCTMRAQAVKERFEEELAGVFGSATVQVRPEFFGVSDTHTLDFTPIQTLRNDYERVDAVLILTEMPRRAHGKPELACPRGGRRSRRSSRRRGRRRCRIPRSACSPGRSAW